LELHEILLCVKKWYSKIEDRYFYADFIEILTKWNLTNLKFYRDNRCRDNHDELFCDCDENTFFSGDCDTLFFYPLQKVGTLPVKYQMLIEMHDKEDDEFVGRYDLEEFISNSLKQWAIENIDTHGISEFAKAINNATLNLCDVVKFLKDERTQREITKMQTTFSYLTVTGIQNAKKINCVCRYHKISFLKLMEKPFIQLVNNYNSYEDSYIKKQGKRFKDLLLDHLPFSILSEILQLFSPLVNTICNYNPLSIEEYMENIENIFINADNMLNEL
ncbi:23491_t:CDS:1, partial [Racocetra persica]